MRGQARPRVLRAPREHRRFDKYRRKLVSARLPFARSAAASALAADPRPDSDEVLLDALGEAGPLIREAVVISLLNRDPDRPMEPIVQQVRRRVKGSAPEPYAPPDARELVDLFLQWCDRFPIAELFTTALRNDPDAVLRSAAVGALGYRGDDPTVADALRDAATRDPDPTVRRQAQNELERKLPFGPPAAPRYGRSA